MNPTSPPPSPTVTDRWGFLFIPCAVALLLLWLPFGFSITGLIEEWDVLALFTLHDPILWVTGDGPLAAHRLRPLTVAPHALAFMLDSDSFYYWHVLLAASLLTKGIASALLGWWLTKSKRWATVLALLVLFYPADTMQLSFRSFHIDWAISLGLFGTTACAYAFTLQRAWQRGIAISLAVITAMLGTFAYEAALTYAVIPFLALFARLGLRDAISQVRVRWRIAAIWVCAAGINVAFILYALRSGQTYQSTLMVGTEAAPMLLERLVRLAQIGYGRSLVGGWLDAAAILYYEFRNYGYLIIALLGCLLVVRRYCKVAPGQAAIADNATPATNVVRLAILGLAIILLGYAPFLASWPHLHISQRTFLAATPGAALVVVAIIIAFARRSEGLGIILASACIALGFSSQIFQFEHYSRLSTQQQILLRDIVANVPPPAAEQTIVIIDKREQLNDVWMLRDGMVMALTYLYGRQINTPVICSPLNDVWQKLNSQGRVGTCTESESGWTLSETPLAGQDTRPETQFVSRDSALVVTLEADGSSHGSEDATEYQAALAHGHSPVARRYRNILDRESWPFRPDLFRQQQSGNDFSWDFGRWWSMEQPTRGAGWLPAGWSSTGTSLPVMRSLTWKNQPVATLQFVMVPAGGPYVLKGRIPQMVPPTSAETMEISINGHPLAPVWAGPTEFSAKVDPGMLRNGNNEIRFESPVSNDPTPLSFLADWFVLEPVTTPH